MSELRVIDLHSHVLPAVDDGSRSVEQSIEMLNAMRAQGISTVVATPHFYANDESVSEFINRRRKAFDELARKWKGELKILLGAEVKYYPGISRMEGLERLRIENSELLLLEMPFGRWTEYVIKEVEDLSGNGRFTVVLAHVERYVAMQKKQTLKRLLQNGILFQVNSSFFIDRFCRSKAIRMLKNGEIHFIGSDCHNMTDRAPNTGEAVGHIAKKLGDTFASGFVNYGNGMFLENN